MNLSPRSLFDLLKKLLLLLLHNNLLLLQLIIVSLMPKKLGNRKRKLERESFTLIFSRFTPKEFKQQTALSRKSFNFLLHHIQKHLPKKVFIYYYYLF